MIGLENEYITKIIRGVLINERFLSPNHHYTNSSEKDMDQCFILPDVGK